MEDSTEQRHISAKFNPRPERQLDYDYAFVEPDAKSSSVPVYEMVYERRVILDAEGNILREESPVLIEEGFQSKQTHFAEMYDKIEALANLTPIETEAIKGFKNLANTLQYLSNQINVDLSPSQKFFVQEGKGIAHASKGRKGWLVDRLKTEKSVLETYGKRLDVMGTTSGWQPPWKKNKGI